MALTWLLLTCYGSRTSWMIILTLAREGQGVRGESVNGRKGSNVRKVRYPRPNTTWAYSRSQMLESCKNCILKKKYPYRQLGRESQGR